MSVKKNSSILNMVIITTGLSPIVRPLVKSGHRVKGIIECAPRSKPTTFKSKTYKLLLGLARFARRSPSLAGYAKKKGISYYYMDHGSDASLENWVEDLQPDLMVVYSMSQLLGENIFSIPKLGTINLHPSCLPDYRGPNPWFWMCYNMDQTGGITIHYIDKGEDTGDIILQKAYEIPKGITFYKLQQMAIEVYGVNLLLKAVQQIASGISPSVIQPKESPTPRARNLTPEEYKNIIDWHNWKVERIWHVLRSTRSTLNAVLKDTPLFKGMLWTVAGYIETKMPSNIPGKLYKESGKYFLACKNGKVFLKSQFRIKQILKALLNM